MADLRFLRDDPLLHDVTFSFADGEVRGAHRCVLAYQSPVFRAMFDRHSPLRAAALVRLRPAPAHARTAPAPCADLALAQHAPNLVNLATLATPPKIPLADKSSSEFDLLLEYCYSCDASLVDSLTAAPLLMLAEEYQVIPLKRRCEEWLVGNVDPATAVDCLLYARQYRCNALEAAAKAVLVKEFEAVAATESLARLPAPLLADALQMDTLFVSSEEAVFQAVTDSCVGIHFHLHMHMHMHVYQICMIQVPLHGYHARSQAVTRWVEQQPQPPEAATAATLLAQVRACPLPNAYPYPCPRPCPRP